MSEPELFVEDDEIEEEEEESILPGLTTKDRNNIKRQLRNTQEDQIASYLHSLNSGGVPIRIQVKRDRPKTWEGKSIDGIIDSFEEPLSIQDIKDMWGGGTYNLLFSVPAPDGTWKYLTCRTIKIAGDPKIYTTEKEPNGHQHGSPDVVRDAMKMAHELTLEERKRADRVERESRNYRDPSVDLFSQELAAARQQQAENQRLIYDILNRQPDSSPTDHLLGKMMDSESARIAQLRAQHESEIRMKNEMHQAEIERLHARYEQNMRWQQEAHQREIETLKFGLGSQEKMLDASYKGQIRALERELEALRSDHQQLKVENAELRSKKDKGLVDSLNELSVVQEALTAFKGDAGEKEEGSAIERIINNVMGSSLAEGVASRLAGGTAAGAMAGMQPNPAQGPQPEAVDPNTFPINQPVQLPDGNVVVRKADGKIVRLKQKKPPQPGDVPEVKVDSASVDIAVRVMESACEKDTDPSNFALSARNIVPPEVLHAIRVQGVDHFLTHVAKLEAHSPLHTMHGKNWVRKVAAVLLGEE